MRRRIAAVTAIVAAVVLSAVSAGRADATGPLRIGALYPLEGALAPFGRQEYRGVEIARDIVNAQGGVHGRLIQLDSREFHDPSAAPDVIAALKHDGVPAVIGTYSSALSIPASAAAAEAGLTYWEAGAVADQVTGRGLPGVFRVGASGSNLGDNSANFTAAELVPRLGHALAATRVSVVYERDSYGTSVGEAAATQSRANGLDVVGVTTYDAYTPDWPRVFAELGDQHPDVVIIASYILDGVSFRHYMLRSGFRAGALIGTTMAECGPDYGALLGADSIGVFASDRPGDHFDPDVLSPRARDAYDRFAQMWQQQTGGPPTEEGTAGFTAAWALFHEVLPRTDDFSSAGIATAARATVLVPGSLPNGAGLRFATDPPRMGQNLDAAAVIWQWQAVGHSTQLWPSGSSTVTGTDSSWPPPPGAVTNNVVVWPYAYATGTVTDVPLSR